MRETLLSFLSDNVERRDETAIVHWRGLRIARLSYLELAEKSFQFARELEARGIVKGERVLIWAGNSPEWIVAFFGCLLRGVVVVPLDKSNTTDFVRRVQNQVGAKLLLAPDDVHLDIPFFPLDSLSNLISHHSSSPYDASNIRGTDLAEVIFTSGTTSEPKGVCLTHKNFLASLTPLENEIDRYRRWERFFHPLRFLSLLPLSHVFGQYMGMFVPQLLGGVVYFRDSLAATEIIRTVRKERISVVCAFPRLLDSLREMIEADYAKQGEAGFFKRALSRAEKEHPLRRWLTFSRVHRRFGFKFWAFISGGATLNEETERFWRALGFAVIQGYGMTESASIISIPHPFKLGPGSIGKPLPGQEMKLSDNGEILVRGDNISSGFWGDEAKSLTDEDRWLHTGDIGEQDSEGYVYFRGRQKDVIVTASGMNIYPEDLEAALERQPEVRASSVIKSEGVKGPEPLAVIILRDPESDPETIVRHANETLAQHQQIRRWTIWPEMDFPRTLTTGKVIKRLIAERINEKEKKELVEPSTGILEHLESLINRDRPELALNRSLASAMNLDSLGRVELLSALEDRYQVELDESAITDSTTVGDIQKMVTAGSGAAQNLRYPYPEWPLYAPATWIRFAVYYLIIFPLTRLLCPMRITGIEHFDQLQGPALIVSNHVTAVDPALILYALPRKWRNRVAVAMLGEFLRDWSHPAPGTRFLKSLRWRIQYLLVVLLFNVFPLPQQSGFRRSFAFAGDAMDRGYNVLLFPEGRRTEDGQMKTFLSGVGLLVKQLNVPVIPVRIDGLFELKQKGKHKARRGDVTVSIGSSMKFDTDIEPSKIALELEQAVRLS